MYKTHDRSFQTVRRECEAWKWGNICSVSVSFVRVGSQIHPHVGPTSGEERFKYPLPRENKIGQTQGQQRRSNPHSMPCLLSPPPPSPPLHRLYVDRCIKEMKKKMKKTIWAPPPPLQSKFNCLMFHSVSLYLDNGTFGLGRVRVSYIAGIRKGREREFGWVASRALSASHAPKITFPFRFEHLPRWLG